MNQDGDGGSDNGGRDIFATNSDIFENRDLLKLVMFLVLTKLLAEKSKYRV